jgi:hypothetical protein
MTMNKLKRFLELKKKLFQGHSFVEVNFKNPEWVEYNELAKEHNIMLKNVVFS